MSEAATEAGNKSGETATADEFKPITSQDDLNTVVKDRLERERAKFKDYGDLKAKAEKFDEIQAASQTEQEKAAEALSGAERRATEAEARALRLEIAAEKGLTPAQAKRLVGSSREELEADADELLTTFQKPAEAENSAVTQASLDLGTRGGTASTGGPAKDFADFLSRLPT